MVLARTTRSPKAVYGDFALYAIMRVGIDPEVGIQTITELDIDFGPFALRPRAAIIRRRWYAFEGASV